MYCIDVYILKYMPPPSPGESQQQYCHLGAENMKRRKRKGENVNEKEEKGKDKGKMASKRICRGNKNKVEKGA
jgi:hypothetical protein